MNKIRSVVVYRRLFLFMVSIAGLYFLYKVKIILIPFVFAFFLAYLLNPLVKVVEKRKVPRAPAILIVYLVVFGLITLAAMYGFPRLLEELNELGHAIPRLTTEVQEMLADLERRFSRFALPGGIRGVFNERISHIEYALLDAVRAGTASLINMFSYLLGLAIAPIFAFYMLKDLDQIKESFTLTIPRRYRADVLAIGRDLDEIIDGFFRCHLVTSVIVGALTGIGMYIIGLDFAFIIGLIAGVAELVPFLGPFLSAIPAVSLALLVSKKTAIYALLVIVVVQQLENGVISPKLLSKSMGLHPLTVIFAIMAGGELYGLVGIILAVPAAASIKIILRYIYLKLVDEKG